MSHNTAALKRWFPAVAALGLAAAVSTGVWVLTNQPAHPPQWTGKLGGLSFTPFTRNGGPAGVPGTGAPSSASMSRDVELVAKLTGDIRTYAAIGPEGDVPALASSAGLRVMAGAWVGADPARTKTEIEALVRLANTEKSVWRVLAGNEALLRGEVTPAALIAILRDLRERVGVPVSTAEPWDIWLKHPELAREVDFIAVHILPYWEGVPAEDATAYIFRRLAEIRAAYPGKPVVLSEIGWPSAGSRIGGALPSPANQALVVRSFLQEAAARGTDYILIEAFDQPWKQFIEGRPGAYWGLYDADRQPKFAMTGPVRDHPRWYWWAVASVLSGVLLALLYLRTRPRLGFTARLAAAAGGQLAGTALVLIPLTGAGWYLSAADLAGWSVLSLAFLVLVAIAASELFEFLDVAGNGAPRRLFRPVPENRAPGTWPKVSIHVPCRNEPPDVVRETLMALSRLEYPEFEVIVLDNNTGDPALWRPIERLCRDLGSRFRFHHLPVCPGFKAGALNQARAITVADAAIIGVIDSDYVVRPNWLKRLVPHFSDEKLGFLQAPQDYRDGPAAGSGGAAPRTPLFKRLCFWEYAGFFRIGMVQRNEDDAIIQHGTMTLIRATALDAAGGWQAGHITEDAELGLRLMSHGWSAGYTTDSFGQGLMPDTFAAWKAQRRRWAYGAMQILRQNAGALLHGGSTRLSSAQRWQFLAGWLPWIGDGLQLVFALGAVVWTALMVLWPGQFGFPPAVFVVPVLVLFAVKIIRGLWLFALRMPCGVADSLGAALAGLALSHTVGRAVIEGLLTRNLPFHRTPKRETAKGVAASLAAIRGEGALLLALALSIGGTVAVRPPATLDGWLWVAMLGAHCVPLMAALAMAAIASAYRPAPETRSVAQAPTARDIPVPPPLSGGGAAARSPLRRRPEA